MSMENEALIKRFMDADRKLREAEDAPTYRDAPAKPVGSLSVEEAKAESRRLAATDPRLVAARAKKQAAKQHAQNAAEYRAAQVRAFALAAEASQAFDLDDNWEDTDDLTWVNRPYENAVAALLDLGPAAEAAIQKLAEEVGADSIMEVAELVQQRDALKAQADLMAEGRAMIQETAEVGKKVEKRIRDLIALNDFVNPDIHLAEAARLRAQLPHIAGPDRVAIAKMIEKAEDDAGAAAERQARAVERFQVLASQMPGQVFHDFDIAEDAMVKSLQMEASFMNAEIEAEAATRGLRARADAEGIGVDSRDAAGRLVLMPPSGDGDALYVSDDAAAGLLAEGFRLIRDEIPPTMPDEIAMFHPQPTPAELESDFADMINEKDATADDDALRAQQEWGARAPTNEGLAAEAEAAEAAERASRLADANQLLS